MAKIAVGRVGVNNVFGEDSLTSMPPSSFWFHIDSYMTD